MHQVSNGQSYFSNDGAFVQRYRWNNGDETFKMYKKLGPNQKFVPATNSNRMLEETGTTKAPSHDGHDHDGHAHDDHNDAPKTTAQTSSFNASKYLPSYSIKLQKIGGYTAPSAANCPAQTGASMVTK